MSHAPIEIRKDGRVVGRSSNLAGILRYPRSRPYCPYDRAVKEIWADQLAESQGRLEVHFADGAKAVTPFASFAVLCGWLRSRRSWYGVPVYLDATHSGELSRTNPQP